MNETLAEYVLRLRTARGWTQEELAEHAGLKQPTVADIERGRSKLPGATIRRGLARALGVRHVDLLVAAGELADEETEPLPSGYLPDPRLRHIASRLPDLDDVDLRHIERVIAMADAVRDGRIADEAIGWVIERRAERLAK